MPGKIGMKKIIKPKVLLYNNCEKINHGVSGFVMIAESHISIHTYPNRKVFYMDVFSCKDFDVEKTKAEINKFFDSKVIKNRVCTR